MSWQPENIFIVVNRRGLFQFEMIIPRTISDARVERSRLSFSEHDRDHGSLRFRDSPFYRFSSARRDRAHRCGISH